MVSVTTECYSAWTMPAVPAVEKYFKINGFRAFRFKRGLYSGKIWHKHCAKAELFWRGWHTQRTSACLPSRIAAIENSPLL
jgi:hypothetical protein